MTVCIDLWQVVVDSRDIFCKRLLALYIYSSEWFPNGV